MAEHAAIAAGLTPDTFAIFKGYAQALEEGQVAILEIGDPVKIVRLEGEANIIVVKVDDDGNEVMGDDGKTPIADNLFPEELDPAEVDDETPASEQVIEQTAPEPEPTPAPAAEKPKTATKRVAKPKVVETPAAAPEPTPEPVAEKPKGRVRKAVEKPAEAEKPAEKQAEAAPITPTPVHKINEMASVTDVVKAEGNDALRAAKALVERGEQTDFTLGGVLVIIHDTGLFKTLGFDGKRGFDEYVEKTLGLASRKARYLMNIYTKFALLGVDEAKLAEIGWSKAKELARIPDAELKRDFNKLVKKANDGTRDDLIAHIKTKYEVVTRGEQVALTSFNFRLAEAESLTVVEGLKEACTAIGEQDNNKALAHIVGEWRGHSAGSDLDLDATIELMMAKFGITKLTFTDAEGNEFEVGGEEAETIAAAA